MLTRTLLALAALLFASAADAQFAGGPAVYVAQPATSTAIAYVGGADLGNTTASSMTAAFTSSSGSTGILLVGVLGDFGAGCSDLSSVTYNGVAMTRATFGPNGCFAGNGSSSRDLWFYYLVNPAGGAHNVVATFATSHFVAMLAVEYSGAKQTGQPDATGSGGPVAATGGTINDTATITTVASNTWVVMLEEGYSGAANTPPAAGTGATRRVFGNAFGSIGFFDSNGPVAAGANSMTVVRSTSAAPDQSLAISIAPGP